LIDGFLFGVVMLFFFYEDLFDPLLDEIEGVRGGFNSQDWSLLPVIIF